MEVSRPSHCHHVPQVGRPQIEPVIRHSAANTAPGKATARAATLASGWRQTRNMMLEIAIPLHPPMPSHAAGTWM
jgi:hypothetical protein